MKSSQLIQNMVLNENRVVQLGFITISECMSWMQPIRRVFKIQLPADSVTKNILYFRDYLHIEKPKFHGIQKFANVVRMIEIKLRVLE